MASDDFSIDTDDGYLYSDDESKYNYNDVEDGNDQSKNKNIDYQQKPISVLQAKRIHSGRINVIGKIVSISSMFQVETINEKLENVSRDVRFIPLEDTEKLDENERLDVKLFDDMVENVVAGEVVEIKGTMLLEDKNKKSKTLIGVLHAESIKYIDRKRTQDHTRRHSSL